MFNGLSIPVLLATLLVVFFGMGLHEYGHALMADYWGDPTPRRNGKLTPNPLAHINPLGWAFYLVMALGFVGQNDFVRLLVVVLFVLSVMNRGALGAFSLGAVAISPHLMRNPRWGSFWTSFAGPLMNLAQAVAAGIILRLLGSPFESYLLQYTPELMQGPLDVIRMFFAVMMTVNTFFFVFNLIPLAPLDGWNMMFSLLPGYFLRREQVPAVVRENLPPISRFLQQPAGTWREWYQLSQFLLIALIVIGMLPGLPSILGMIISPPATVVLRLLIGF